MIQMSGNPGETSVLHSFTLFVSSAYRLLGVTGVHQGTPDFQDPLSKQNAYSERPLDVQPIDQGVAIDGRRDHLPEGHANVSDKIVGKMQKVNPSSCRSCMLI